MQPEGPGSVVYSGPSGQAMKRNRMARDDSIQTGMPPAHNRKARKQRRQPCLREKASRFRSSGTSRGIFVHGARESCTDCSTPLCEASHSAIRAARSATAQRRAGRRAVPPRAARRRWCPRISGIPWCWCSTAGAGRRDRIDPPRDQDDGSTRQGIPAGTSPRTATPIWSRRD